MAKSLIFDLQFMSTPLVSFVLSVIQFTVSDYTFVIFKIFAIVLSVLWITVYVYTFGILCIVCYSIYGFWLHLCYLQTFGHYTVCPLINGLSLHLWYPLYCLLFNLRFMSTPLVSFVLSVIQFTRSDFTFVIFYHKGVIRNRKLNNRQYKGYQRCRNKP
jgi:hypothetical protein